MALVHWASYLETWIKVFWPWLTYMGSQETIVLVCIHVSRQQAQWSKFCCTSGRSMDWERKNLKKKKKIKLKKWLFLTFWMDTSNARNKNLRPLFNTNIPPISGKYGLRNHFWSLESGFLMRKREENDFFSKICNNSILRFTYLKSAQNFWLFCISTFFGLLQAR